jgi:hypothetical protein
MLRTLCRLDKLAAVHRVFTQLGMMDGTTASYTAMILAGGKPQPRAILVIGTDDVDENGPAAKPKVLSSVKLCQRPGTPLSTLFDLNLSHHLQLKVTRTQLTNWQHISINHGSQNFYNASCTAS